MVCFPTHVVPTPRVLGLFSATTVSRHSDPFPFCPGTRNGHRLLLIRQHPSHSAHDIQSSPTIRCRVLLFIPAIIPRAWNSGSRELKIHHAHCLCFHPRSPGHKVSLSPHTTANGPDSVLVEVPFTCYTLRTFRRPQTWCSEHPPVRRDLPRPILRTLESESVQICPDAAIP